MSGRIPVNVNQLGATPSGVISEAAKRRIAERKLEEAWTKLGGAPGAQTIPGDAGLTGSDDRYFREYANGGLYYNYGEPVFVYGAIGSKYRQLGGPTSWLGWPTSNELDFPEGGRVSKFDHGFIYWWPDTGALELGDVAMRYRGLLCFSESNEPSDSDEPYAYFTVVPPPPAQPSTLRTPIYDDVDAGKGYPDTIELYRGLPFGLAVGIVLMEHDVTDPDKYREPIKGIVGAASTAVVGAVTLVPGIGPVLGVGAGALLAAANGDIVDALNELVGGKPDHIGTVSLEVTAKQMVTLARAQLESIWGVGHHLQSPLISGDGADYKLCFDIRAV